MRVFVFEFLIGGGALTWDVRSAPPDTLLAEGTAMWRAVVEDLQQTGRCEIAATCDARVTLPTIPNAEIRSVSSAADLLDQFEELARTCDATIVIAPEIRGELGRWSERVLEFGGRLATCPPDMVRIASSKNDTCECLSQAGIPSTAGVRHLGGDPWPVAFNYPAVWKPDWGAGSWALTEVAGSNSPIPQHVRGIPGRLEPRRRGRPASVVVFSSQHGHVQFPPCFQFLSPETFEYRGGRTIEHPRLAERARALVTPIVGLFPKAQGFWGVDLLLGDDASGSEDCAVEVNPRVCTSYVGLRKACTPPLGEYWLKVLWQEPSQVPRPTTPGTLPANTRLAGTHSADKNVADALATNSHTARRRQQAELAEPRLVQHVIFDSGGAEAVLLHVKPKG